MIAKTGKRIGLMKKQKPWIWEQEHQQTFEEAKRILVEEVMISFSDLSKPLHLYSDASNFQLGETLVQEGQPLRFYTWKLNLEQLNYTVGEKELLGIVDGNTDFEGMIRGFYLTIHTDHLNLLYNNLLK